MRRLRRWAILLAFALIVLAGLLLLRRDAARIIAGYCERHYFIREIVAAGEQTGIDPGFLAAMVYVESRFNPDAVSASGAVGLMQLMPGTAREVAARHHVRFSDTSLREPATNVLLGALYFKDLHRHFRDTDLAMAAYNAGPRSVREWLADRADTDVATTFNMAETRRYVAAVNEVYGRWRKFRSWWKWF